jgi:hypothetical protein
MGSNRIFGRAGCYGSSSTTLYFRCAPNSILVADLIFAGQRRNAREV